MSAAERPRTAQFGEYTITGKLGEGGMCVVYRARKKGDLQDCALKLLREERRTDERVLDLFVTEADLSLLLHHPNLIETYDAGEIDGRYYIAMELVEGANLKEISSQCERSEAILAPARSSSALCASPCGSTSITRSIPNRSTRYFVNEAAQP